MYPYGNNQFGGYGAPPGQPMSPNPAAPQYANQAFGADPNQPQQFYGQSPAPVNPYGTINTNTITNFGSVYAGDNMGAYASNVGVAANTTGGYNSVAPYATTSFNVQPAGYSTGLSSAPSYSTNSFVNQSVPQGFISDPFGQGSFPSTPINPINSGYVAPVAPPSVDAFTGAFYMNPTDPSTYTTMYIPPVDPQNTFNSNTNAVNNNNNQQYGASPQQQQQQQQQQQSFVSSPLSVTEELALKEGWMWKFTASTGWVQQYNIIEKSHGGYLLGFPQPPEGGAAPQSLSPLPQSKCTVVGLDEFPWDVQSLNFKDPCVFLFQCFQPPSEDIYFVCDGYDNLMDWVVKFEKFNTQLDLTGAVSYSQKAINQAIQELQQCWLPWQQDQTELRLKQEHLDNVARKKEQELYQQQQQIMQQSSFPVSSSSSVANVGVIDEKQALLDQIERQKQEFERVLREQKLQMEKEYKALEDKKAVDWIKSNDDWRQFFKSSLGLSDEELQNPEIAKVLIERTLTAVHQPDSAPAQSQPSSSSPSQLQQQHQEYQQIAPQAQQPPVFDQQQQFQVPPAQQQPAFDQQQQYQVPPVQQQQYQAPAQQQQYQAPVQQQPAFDQQQQQYQAPPAQQQPTFDQQQQYQAPPAQQQQYQAPVQQQPAFDQQQQQQQQYQAPPAQQQQYQAPVQQQQQQPAFDQQQYQQTPQTLNAEFSAASLRPPPPPPTEEAQPSQPSYSAPAPPLSQSGPPTGGPPPPPPSGGPPPPPPPPPAGGPRPPPAMPSASGPPKPKPQAAMPSIADMINAGTPQLRKVVPTDPADKPPVPSGDPRTNMFAEMKNKKLRATVIQPKQMSEDTSNDLKNILMRTLTKFRPMLKETATDSDEEKDAENW